MVDVVGLPLNVADLLPTLVKLTKKVTEQVKLLAGHYVPHLASLILSENKKTNGTNINLRVIVIGNDVIDDNATSEGIYDYCWTHALNYDETNAGINEYCGYGSGNFSAECLHYQSQSGSEYGEIDIYNIYAPFCDGSIQKHATRSVKNFDPCSDDYVLSYLNRADVQEALHVRNTSWGFCGDIGMIDSPTTILPTITQLIENGISVWIYSSVKPDVLEEEREGDFGRSQHASDALSKGAWYASVLSKITLVEVLEGKSLRDNGWRNWLKFQKRGEQTNVGTVRTKQSGTNSDKFGPDVAFVREEFGRRSATSMFSGKKPVAAAIRKVDPTWDMEADEGDNYSHIPLNPLRFLPPPPVTGTKSGHHLRPKIHTT
ncbi:unnamed protein product [Lactuca saligna]|uniref:Uncharacterized protein n=1 Tax=Lactuca saligna TaxID=75948 RepID=A0AA36A444_LACSI|nr:unnamed protein product [Lactuca saligna]